MSTAEADAAYGEGRFEAAARLYGRVTAASPSFEETALKFVEAAQPAALRLFLAARLEVLGPADKAQVGSQANEDLGGLQALTIFL